MLPQWVIEKKRDKQALTDEEIQYFIDGYTSGDIPDYQMAAMAMAIYLNGMTFEETAKLTDCMMRSGDLVDTSAITVHKSDKHSTGGIGDKVSLILAPLIACCGIGVPMISGRGLGITGGTLDKMESIPGYRTGISEEELIDVVQKCGCSIIGQTGQLAPADKKLYALRDVTATVPSIPLITASIMCKKMAEGIDSLVLDVKCGKGAFMQNIDDARELARNMVEVGTCMGKKVSAIITDMNEPLGRTAGNALEVIESIECLQGKPSPDLMEVTLALCARMLVLAGQADTDEAALSILQGHIDSGAAFKKFKEMVKLHGGDVSTIDDPSKLPQAAIVQPFPSPASGTISEVDANNIGRGVLLLGAGRTKTDQAVDFAVGVADLLKVGDKIKKGQALLTIHANSQEQLKEAEAYFEKAFTIADQTVPPTKRILETIESGKSS